MNELNPQTRVEEPSIMRLMPQSLQTETAINWSVHAPTYAIPADSDYAALIINYDTKTVHIEPGSHSTPNPDLQLDHVEVFSLYPRHDATVYSSLLLNSTFTTLLNTAFEHHQAHPTQRRPLNEVAHDWLIKQPAFQTPELKQVTAKEWFQHNRSDLNGIDYDTTDQELNDIAESIRTDAERYQQTLIDGVLDHIASYRNKLHA